MTNPLKTNKIQFGNSANDPSIENSNGSLRFFDSSTGVLDLGDIKSQKITTVKSVSPTLSGADFTTIQEAIDSIPVNNLGVIHVYEGTYNEFLQINGDIVLIGYNAILSANGADLITSTDHNLTIQGFTLNMGVGGNPNIINFVSTNNLHSLVVSRCTFNTENNLNANFVYNSRGVFYLYGSYFEGTGSIECLESLDLNILGTHLPDITLRNIIGICYIVCSDLGALNLIDTTLNLNGEYTSLSGDNNSVIHKKVIVGSVEFVNETNKVVTLDCPFSTADYQIITEAVSDRTIPIIVNKTTTTFEIEFEQNKTLTLNYQIFQK